MADVKIILPDGSAKEYAAGTTLGEAVKQLSNSLAKKVLAANVNGELTDLREELVDGSEVAFLTFEEDGGKHTLRHTASHILAQAVKRLWPEAKLAIGPAIDKGFYYNIDMEHTLTPEDLGKIEKEMGRIVKENLPITKSVMSRQEAIEFFKSKNEDYKVELIQDLPEDAVISCYSQGDFIDLCAGPHVASTGKVKAFKLQSIAGAYWRGDEKNKMLQRIYGTAFEKKEELDAYLHMLEEAAKRDHRKLGKELGLFVIKEEGPGFPFFLPKGMALRNELENFWREVHHEFDYEEIRTPIILNKQLWETSGHWFHYRENMYTTIIDDEEYAIKPMNCPGHVQIFNQGLKSYRDLPIRMAEFGSCHRNEPSGSLHGLMRVRGFTQDDAHIFCTEDQIESEVTSCIKMVYDIYSTFGFQNIQVKLSTRPEKRIGADDMWDRAEAGLAAALAHNGLEYEIQEGEGAFYGPKIEFALRDCLDREWQCGTIQLDFALPGRLNASYVAEDNDRRTPVMIHRAILGSIERFIGIITEEYAGFFPAWLAPVQAIVMNITDSQADYVQKVVKQLSDAGLRVKADLRNEKVGFKIREHTLRRVPYMLVCGDKEIAEGKVAVRTRKGADLGTFTIEEFAEILKSQVRQRELKLLGEE